MRLEIILLNQSIIKSVFNQLRSIITVSTTKNRVLVAKSAIKKMKHSRLHNSGKT